MITESTPAYWHGCWLEAGHFLFDRHGRTVYHPHPLRDMRGLDGGFAPRRWRAGARPVAGVESRPDGYVFAAGPRGDCAQFSEISNRSDEVEQGNLAVHRLHGYTLASWWDRTQGDTRGACSSCFIVEGEHTTGEMLEWFPRMFPKQAERLRAAGVPLRCVVITP